MTATGYHDGALLPADTIVVAADDAGLLLGDGLFETLLVHAGRPVDPIAHLERLYSGLEAVGIGIPESPEHLAEAVARVAAGAAGPHARLRITITRGARGRGPTRLILAFPCERPGATDLVGGVALCVDPQLMVRSDDPHLRLKSTSYQGRELALHRARAAGAREAVLLNEHGRVAEGTRSNVLARFADEVVTPPLDEGCLPGTVRRRLLESAVVTERPVSLERLRTADEIMLTNSLVGVLPVGRFDDRLLEPGPAARTLRRHWEETWLHAP